MQRVPRTAAARFARCFSDGFTVAAPNTADSFYHDSGSAWSHRNHVEHEQMQSMSTKEDERQRELFGHDPVAWVHVVRSTDTSGKVDPERRALWEKPVYSQQADLRNSWGHHAAEGVIKKHQQGRNVFARFPNAGEHYLGWYPTKDENDPGQYWKRIHSKNLYTNMLQNQEFAREHERFGGEFAVPCDDFQAHNGVTPLLSPATYEHIKYDVHDSLVRALNAATDGGKVGLEDAIRFAPEKSVQRMAIAHQALMFFQRSIRPRGGVLRPEFENVLVENFGGRASFINAIMSAARAAQGDATVWVVINPTNHAVEVMTCAEDDAPQLQKRQPLAALVLREDIWARDFDSAEEFAERFIGALDYDQVYAQYCHFVGALAPEPLVF